VAAIVTATCAVSNRESRYPLREEGMVTERPRKKGKKYMNCTPSKSRHHEPILLLLVFNRDTNRISTLFFFCVKNMSRCVKYQKPGQGVGVGFCHSCHSVKMLQKHLGLLESSRGPPDNFQTDTYVSCLRSHIPMGTLCN